MNIKSFFIVCLSILFFTCDTPKKYNVIGVIKEIDKDKNKLLIDHDEIPGFMVKMVMFFNLHTSVDINQFSVNDSVKFDLIIKDKNSYSLNYDIIGKSKISTKEDFWEDDEDLKYSLKEAGDSIDNATFLDVNNKEISLSDFKSDFLLISFIFSKCPMPNMCPAAIVKNQYLSNHFENENIDFLLISFDYLFDTPEVLKSMYGSLEKENLHFLSSYKHINDIFTLSQQAGVAYWGVEENNIGHTMRTLLIDKDLKLVNTYDGMDWRPSEAKKDIENLIKIYY
jgi:protein SCO1/2